jgi:hypothetical protein
MHGGVQGPARGGPEREERPVAFADYQNEIYLDGLRGVVPRLPMTYAELEAPALADLTPQALRRLG